MKKIYFLSFIFIFFFLKINAQVIVLQPDAANGYDVFTEYLIPSINFGTGPSLEFGGKSWQNDTLNTYIKFDLSSVTPGTTITSARVDLYYKGSDGALQGQCEVDEVTQSWNETTLLWNNQPQYDTFPVYTFSANAFAMDNIPGWKQKGWRSLVLPDTLVQKWVDNPAINNGFVLRSSGGFYGCALVYSSDYSVPALRPRIVLNSPGAGISGVVTDSVTGNPLPGVILAAYNLDRTLKYAQDTSDASGNYNLNIFYPDTFNIIIDGLSGYLPCIVDSLIITEGQALVQNISVMPDPHAIAGIVSGTWGIADSPYIITGDIIVEDSTTLNVEPGVEILYAGPYQIAVYGSFNAVGNETDSIIFTSYDLLELNKGRGIRFYDADPSDIEYCRIERMNCFDQDWGQVIDDCGGGIYSHYTSIKIQHNTIRRNYAQAGGGMYINNSNQNRIAWIDHNRIGENNAQYHGSSSDGGAGAYIISSYIYENIYFNENLILDNEYFDDNQGSNEGGGGLYVAGGIFRIINNTFYNNKAFKGPAIYAAWYKGKILNNIFWSNHGSVHNEQVAVNTSTFDPYFEASYNCVPDSGIIQWTSSVVVDSVPGVNNIYTYPDFADTLADHFWLDTNSPCIDTGSNHYLYSQYDYLDRCRIFDGDANGTGIVDIGAYEYNASSFYFLDLGPDYSVCYDTANIVSAGQFYDHYQWSTGDTTYLTHVLNTDSFYVTVSNVQGCYAFDSVNVTVLPLPVVNLPGDTALCGDFFDISTQSGFSSYMWNGSTAGTEMFHATSGGDYWVYVTDSNNCSAYSDTMNLELFEVPVIVLPDTTIPLSNGSVFLEAGIGYASYEWSNGDNTHAIVVFGNYLGVGTHSVYVTVTTQDGCTAVGEAVIHVYDDTGIDDLCNSVISIFPDPAVTFITLNGISSREKVTVQICDGIGKPVIDKKIDVSGKSITVDISSLSSGMYILRIIDGDGEKKARFVKQ